MTIDSVVLFEIREFLQDIVGGAAINERSVECAKEFVAELDAALAAEANGDGGPA